MATAEPDLAAVRRALEVLADPADGFQLTAAPAWPFGTFRLADLDEAAGWVAGVAGRADAVYVGLNPVPAGLDRRLRNEDVLRRRNLLVDVDRVKAAGDRHLSATADEHAGVLGLAEEVREYLHGRGWPAPALHVDSGNGAHLIYRVDWPNDPESARVLAAFLKALAARFDGPHGTLDRAVHDARRISKVPGTWARKGPDAPDRPHRMARILDATDPPGAVPLGLAVETTLALAGAAALGTPGVPAAPAPPPEAGSPRVVPAAGTPEAARLAYARRALDGECERMRAARPGELNNQLFRSAAALGNLVGSGLLGEGEVMAALLAAGEAAGCDDPRKDRATVARGVALGRTTPRAAPERPGGPSPAPAAGNGHAAGRMPAGHPVAREAIARAAGLAGSSEAVVLPLPSIMSTVYPPPRYAVEGIISEGLNVLAGKSKLGKSWLALNLALTIAAGGVALGDVPVQPGAVLYLALEDRFRRIQDRSRKVLGGLGVAAPDRLYVATDWPRLDTGGLDRLCEWIESQGGRGGVSDVRLVIVDVWAKFRPVVANSRASAYDLDYAHMAALKHVLDHYAVSGLILHHTRKAAAADAIDEVSGTAGIAGCADGILVLTRARNQDGPEFEAELMVTGRDQEEQKLSLTVDRTSWVWTSNGSAGARVESRVALEVLRVLRSDVGAQFGIRTILDCISQVPKPTVSHLRTILVRLVDRGLAERVRDGYYRVPVPGEAFGPA